MECSDRCAVDGNAGQKQKVQGAGELSVGEDEAYSGLQEPGQSYSHWMFPR